ncbi:MAG: hypothetical protein IT355_09880 [Gemmatimonadaceae bacterium]|nr:hypothetical protein [Gemmatimonadaceae bacterium]
MTFAELEPLLAASRATPAFRTDLAAFTDRRTAPRITAGGGSPRVKVLRTIAQLLHAEPAIEVDSVHVDAISGCADFVGQVLVTDVAGGQHRFAFEWNCEWKARERGYTDWFGLPDQIRAAQEFGWQCFSKWTRAGETTTTRVA